MVELIKILLYCCTYQIYLYFFIDWRHAHPWKSASGLWCNWHYPCLTLVCSRVLVCLWWNLYPCRLITGNGSSVLTIITGTILTIIIIIIIICWCKWHPWNPYGIIISFTDMSIHPWKWYDWFVINWWLVLLLLLLVSFFSVGGYIKNDLQLSNCIISWISSLKKWYRKVWIL